MKKSLSVILAIVAILTMFCACSKTPEDTETTAPAKNEFTYEDYVYTILTDGTAKIIKYTGTDDVNVLEIPRGFNGAKVTVIGEGAFKGAQNIGKVIFPRYLTKIEAHAFEGSSIKKAMMETSKIAEICEYAFAECPNLVQVDFSPLAETVADKAFYLCSSIKVVTFRSDIVNIDAPQAFDTGSSNIQTINCVTESEEPFICAKSLAVSKGFPVENITLINPVSSSSETTTEAAA